MWNSTVTHNRNEHTPEIFFFFPIYFFVVGQLVEITRFETGNRKRSRVTLNEAIIHRRFMSNHTVHYMLRVWTHMSVCRFYLYPLSNSHTFIYYFFSYFFRRFAHRIFIQESTLKNYLFIFGHSLVSSDNNSKLDHFVFILRNMSIEFALTS